MYYTESDENGNFTLNMAPYTDALGVTREFRADASVGTPNGGDWSWDENREKIRVWTELPEDMTDTYRLVHQPAAGIFPGIGVNTTPTTQGDATWGGNKITGMTIQYAQKDKLPQHLPENKWVESTGTGGNGGTYAGRAFWNLDVLQGALNHNTVSAFGGKDIPAAGMKVVGSYLTDDAVKKIEEYAKGHFAGKTLRGKDWTVEDEQGLQRWINEQVAADPEGWIAETLTTTTGTDGKFELRWKGIYGNSYNSRGIVSADKFGKLAGSHKEGAWENGGLNSKHVNMHWSYVSILDKEGNPLPDNIGTLYPWSLGQWAGPGFGADLNAGANAQLFGGDGAFIGNETDGYTGWNIVLTPQALKFDVVDKNTTDNWAEIGDTVQTDTAGLPISDDLQYYIEWYDKDGKFVKRCQTQRADAATKIPSCELEVPADAQSGDTFTARLKVTAGNPDPANDLVLAMDAFAVSRDYLKYEPVNAKVDEEATSEPKFDNPETETEETKPGKAKFELGKLPEGVTEDQVKVDPKTGVVTFTPNADQADKTFNFPVVMRDEALQVPVLDENGDPVKDESGNAKTQGRVVARGEAVFNVVKDDDGDGIAPDPDGDNDGEPDDPNAPEVDAQGVTFSVKIDGKIVESDGNNDTAEELPESVRDVVVTLTAEDGTEFKSNDNGETWRGAKDYPLVQNFGSKDLPKGKYTVSVVGVDDIDKDDLKLKKDSQLRDGATVEITGNTGNLFVELETVDSKNYEPGYEDGSGKPGEDVKVEKPDFKDKDGKDTEAPEGTTFGPGENAPDGVTIDENTGEITVTIPEDAKPGDEITVPVEVTYPDGSKDNVDVTVTVEEPDAPEQPGDKDADTYEPAYEGKLVVPGEETKSSPTFTDKDGKDAEVPADSKFTIGEDFTVPEGYEVKIDESTGEITVTFPDESKLNKDTVEEFDVPVTVTYPDGSTDKADANFKLDTDNDGKPDTEDEDDDGDGIPDEEEKEKGSNPKDEGSIPATPIEPGNPTNAATFEPEYKDGFGKPGTTAPVDAPTFTNKDGDKVTVPEGTKFTTDKDGVEVAEDGSLKVQIPEDAKPGDKITVPVEVTYPDGSKDNVDVTVTVTDPESKPKWGDDEGEPGDKVTVPNEGGDVPEGTTVETDGPGKAEIDEDGNLIVDIDEDAKPGDKIVVEVKDPEGNTIDESTVTVTEPPALAENPDWKDDKGKPGDKVEIPNTGGDVPEGTTVETEGPGKAEIDENGNLIVDIDKDAKPGDKVVVVVKDKDGNEIDRVVVEVEKPKKPIIPGGPTWPIDPNKPGEDDPSETPEVIKPTIDPAKDGDKEITGTGKPGTDLTVTVTDKDGKKTEKTVTVGDDGKWKVVVDKELKTGDKIVATDKDGNEAERIVTGDSKPAPKPDDSDWTGSSNLSERCINTGLGIGIPLLFLIPVGLASQMNIPGLSEFVAPINKQIQDLNTRLQQQAGLFNGPLADQVNGINAQLKRFGADYQQAAGAVALIAAGALAIGLLADACAPGADEGSSK